MVTAQNTFNGVDTVGGVNLFTRPDRDLVLRDGTAPCRDGAVKKVYKSLLLMATGIPVNLVVTGSPGSGKRHVLDRATRMHFPVDNMTIARCGSLKHVSRKELYTRMFRSISSSKKKPPIRAIREAVKAHAKEHPLIIVVNDVDCIDRRFKSEFFSIPVELGGCMACTAVHPVKAISSWERVHLDKYTRGELKEVMLSIMKGSVKDGVYDDVLPLDILIDHVVEKFNSDMGIALDILKRAIILVENQCLFKKRDDPVLLIIDIENAIQQHVNDAMKEETIPSNHDFTSSIVFSIVCVKPGMTISSIHDVIEKVMDKTFPGKKVPARSTVGNVLRKLRDRGMVLPVKTRPEKKGGVVTTWHPIKSKKHLASDFLTSYAMTMIKEALQ